MFVESESYDVKIIVIKSQNVLKRNLSYGPNTVVVKVLIMGYYKPCETSSFSSNFKFTEDTCEKIKLKVNELNFFFF